MQQKQLSPLTSLRFFAAIMVVFFHHQDIFYPLFVEKMHFYTGFLFVHHGYATVAFFFVLSGFILAYNYYNKDFDTRKDKYRFYIARIARIYPAYFFALLLSLPVAIFYFVQQPGSFSENIKALFMFTSSVFMLHAWIPFWLDSVGNVNGPGWSLSVEFLLYLVFPFAIMFLRKLKWKTYFVLLPALILAGLSLTLLFEYQYFGKVILMSSPNTLEVPDGGIAWQMLVNTLPIVHVPQFIIGIIFGILFIRYKPLLQKVSRFLLLPSFLLIVWLFASDHFSSRSLEVGLMAVPYAFFIAMAGADNTIFSKLLSVSPLVRLGEISYSIYIFAFPIESYFNWFLKEVLHQPRGLFSFSIYMVVLILFCNWFYKYEEYFKVKIKSFLTPILIVSKT